MTEPVFIYEIKIMRGEYIHLVDKISADWYGIKRPSVTFELDSIFSPDDFEHEQLFLLTKVYRLNHNDTYHRLYKLYAIPLTKFERIK